MNDLIEPFLVEVRELIQSATEDLLTLESTPGDGEAVNRVFRAFHTLKGSVGLFDFPPMLAALHAAEDGLAAARAGRLAIDGALIDLSLETLDATAHWTDAIEASGGLPETAPAQAATLARRYRSLLVPEGDAAEDSAVAVPAWVAPLLAASRGGDAARIALRYRPRADCFFAGDDPLGLVRRVPDLHVLQVRPDASWPALEAYDPFACNLTITLLSGAGRETIDALFRLVRDQVTVVTVLPAEPATSPGTGLDAVSRAVLAEQAALLAVPVSADASAGHVEAACRSIANTLRAAGLDAAAAGCAAAAGAGATAAIAAVTALLEEPDPAPANLHADGPAPGEGARTVRVDSARVDELVALVGEFVVARNGLGRLAERAEAGTDAAALARSIREADAVLGRLAGALHRSAVSLRLLPMSQVFRRFARPVRETARGLGKAVELEMRGEETEADKAIVENLFEPLLHVVRNALDHGLEDAPARARAGKPAAGRIVLSAHPAEDRIVVSVSDDGRGIDPAFIRRRMEERGLRTAQALADLDDDAVIDLIFAPGFSTTDRVSAVSGRGVGMDAVRRAAERLGGRVAVESRVGHGTTIRLILSRTVSLTRILTVGVGVGGQRYGIAMDTVSEAVRQPRAHIHAIAGGQATVLRGRTVPVVGLGTLLGDAPASGSPDPDGEALLLLVRDSDGIVALEIDRIADRIDAVLRPPGDLIGTVPGIAGTTILGDGRVLLVLDPAALLAAGAAGPRPDPEPGP